MLRVSPTPCDCRLENAIFERLHALHVSPLHVIDAITNTDTGRIALLRRRLWCARDSLVAIQPYESQVSMLRLLAAVCLIHWLREWLENGRLVSAYGAQNAGIVSCPVHIIVSWVAYHVCSQAKARYSKAPTTWTLDPAARWKQRSSTPTTSRTHHLSVPPFISLMFQVCECPDRLWNRVC